MHLRSIAVVSLMASLSAQNLVYDNGPLQTGVSGANAVSVLQTLAPIAHTTFGYGAQQTAADRRLIDNFTVNSFLQIDEIEVFGYATGATAPSCTGVYLKIWDNNPQTSTPNQLIAGAGAGVNLVTAPGFTVTNTFTNIYRVTDTALTGTTRNIQSVRVDLATPLVLNPGTYYLEYSFDGVNFVPPISATNVNVTGDGIQVTTTTGVTTYVTPVLNGTGAQGFPFKFYSSVGSPFTAGSITNLGGGCSTSSMTLVGAPTVGGFVRAELANVNPLAVGAIVIGASNPNAPLFVCACTSRASLDVLNVGNSFDLTVPLQASLVGTELFFQGAEIDLLGAGGIGACNLGVQFSLTDGYSFKLNFN
jgi:hypothetical protein